MHFLSRPLLSTVLALSCLPAMLCQAQRTKTDHSSIHPVAIFPFTSRSGGQEEHCSQAFALLFAELSTRDDLMLVERAEIAKLLEEQELSLGGLVNPATALVAGQLTGAKIIVTGSIFEVGQTTYVVAKIIGTETSRVLGASVKGDGEGEFDVMIGQLAGDIATLIRKRSKELVAPRLKSADRVTALAQKLGKRKRPTLWIEIKERHIGHPTLDPAAQTELVRLCRETGFEVIDAETGNRRQADVLLLGEAFSELAVRRDNLVSVKGRVELRAVNSQDETVIDAAAQTALSVDVAELSASKSALETATADLAMRLLPQITNQHK